MEGNVGEDKERVGVLRKLLESGHVVLTSEGQVDQEAEILRSIFYQEKVPSYYQEKVHLIIRRKFS